MRGQGSRPVRTGRTGPIAPAIAVAFGLAAAAMLASAPPSTGAAGPAAAAGPGAQRAVGSPSGVLPGTSCPVFPADSWWHADVSGLPVHARSADWLRKAGSVFVSVDTRVGPVYLALGATHRGGQAVYVFLGPFW